MKKGQYPAKDGWLHLRAVGDNIDQEELEKIAAWGRPIEVAFFKQYKTRAVLMYRYLTPKRLVEKFNANFPKGSKVNWRNHQSEPFSEYTVRTPAFISNSQAVVFLKEKPGYVSIEPKFLKYESNIL